MFILLLIRFNVHFLFFYCSEELHHLVVPGLVLGCSPQELGTLSNCVYVCFMCIYVYVVLLTFSEFTYGFFRPPNHGEAMHAPIPPNAWHPMSQHGMVSSSDAMPSFGSQVAPRSGDGNPSSAPVSSYFCR